MTTVDMDKASIELASAAGAIAERYGLTASALFYVLKKVETQVSEARVSELLTAPEAAEEQAEEPKKEDETPGVKTIKRNSASLDAVKAIIAEKIAAGDVDENGRAHCSLREAAERTKANDSSDN